LKLQTDFSLCSSWSSRYSRAAVHWPAHSPDLARHLRVDDFFCIGAYSERLPVKANSAHPMAHSNASEIATAAARPSFGPPRVPEAVRTSHLSCGKARNTQKFTPVGVVQVISARNNLPLHAQQSDHNCFFAILFAI
jgi:hypothetical protein